MSKFDIKVAHMCCGLGGGARGFKKGFARIGQAEAHCRNVGGFDIDAAGIADFERMADCRGTVIDLMARDQFRRFHGHEPPESWREATPADIRRGCAYEAPNIWFTSSPCKGLSGLLSEAKSKTEKYQALNELTLRSIWLCLEAFPDDPAEFILFENVPRIQNRGRHLLDQIVSLLRAYGYAVAETTHDCGELGGLAQSRKRFLLVARHMAKVPQFLYEPARKPLRAVGDVLGRLPLPNADVAGGLHRLPQLQWRTWVRLAFVRAGSDWRSLNELAVQDGYLKDYGILPAQEMFRGAFGVKRWTDHADTVTSKRQPSCGPFSVADPRFDPARYECNQYGVIPWSKSTGAVINVKSPGQGTFAVSDPRLEGGPRFNNAYKVVRFDGPSAAVAGPGGPGGGLAVADPRHAQGGSYTHTKYQVTDFEQHSRTVIGASTTGDGAFAVTDPRYNWGPDAHPNKLMVQNWQGPSKTITGARFGSGLLAVSDPRPGLDRARGSDYLTAGHYGVVPFSAHSYAVTGNARHDNGHGNVADPRLPALEDRMACVIVAEDGTWHRPFTTLELASLQSLFDLEEYEHFELHGKSDSDFRERIGNAVPSDTAEAIANVMAQTLLLAWTGNTQILGEGDIWVRPMVAAIQFGASA